MPLPASLPSLAAARECIDIDHTVKCDGQWRGQEQRGGIVGASDVSFRDITRNK
jgi:hypothetical protein